MPFTKTYKRPYFINTELKPPILPACRFYCGVPHDVLYILYTAHRLLAARAFFLSWKNRGNFLYYIKNGIVFDGYTVFALFNF